MENQRIERGLFALTAAALISALPLQVSHADSMNRETDNHANRKVDEQSSRSKTHMTSSQSDVQEDVREVVREMVAAAAHGDLEDYVDYLSKEDRARIESNRSAETINGFSDGFTDRWEKQYSRSLDSGLGGFAVPVTVNEVTENSARVTIGASGQNSGVTLRLVKGGWFNNSWRIDAPNSLTLPTLQSQIQECLAKFERDGVKGQENQALTQAMVELLRPVAIQG